MYGCRRATGGGGEVGAGARLPAGGSVAACASITTAFVLVIVVVHASTCIEKHKTFALAPVWPRPCVAVLGAGRKLS
jgi:hypothetical protein